MSKKKGLGRGLDHLISQNSELDIKDENEITMALVRDIRPNPYQPRKVFDQNALNELAESIKENGLFQPILVRGSILGYEIISGERRFRAAKIAGLSQVPVIVYDYDDQKVMEIAIVENVQREDLSIVEEARSYESLINKLGYTQEQVAQKVGKSRSHITNIIRLLKLDEEIIELLEKKMITMGHVKVLVTIDDKEKIQKIVKKIIEENLSVRAAEELASRAKGKTINIPTSKKQVANNSRNIRLENIIREKIDAKVSIKGDKKGSIEIKFNNQDDLERILDELNLI